MGQKKIEASTCRDDLLDDRWIVHLYPLPLGTGLSGGGLDEREVGDDALFGETFGGVDADEDGEDEIRHADDHAWCRSQSRRRACGEFDFEPAREEDLFRESDDDADGVYRGVSAGGTDKRQRGVCHVDEERPGAGVALCPPLADAGFDCFGEVAVVEGVGDVVGLAGGVEGGWGEVEVEGEVEGLGAGAVPVVGADGGGEMEGGEGDDVGVQGG